VTGPETILPLAAFSGVPSLELDSDGEPKSQGGMVSFRGPMNIDADGAGEAWKQDKTGQSSTSLRYADGKSLDPSQIPFIVIPLGFEDRFPGVKLGDYAVVSYNGKTAFAIVGDYGPRGKLGEGSIALADSLGIPSDPNRGGTSSGVTYLVFSGSRDSEPPRDPAALQGRGQDILKQKGLSLSSR
jgi:hypothetical protein